MEHGLIDIRTVAAEDKGQLSFLEANVDIPFSIERVYYTYDVPAGVKRGGHAHHALQQLLICPSGSIEVILNDGMHEESYLLDDPSKGLLVADMVWHDMIWKESGSVLVVAASMQYDERDYIRDFDEFMGCVRNGTAKRGSY